MDLNRRIKKLESQIVPNGSAEMDIEIERWARLFAEARHDGFDVDVLEEDRSAAREFIDACQAAGEKPGFMAMMKMAHEEDVRNSRLNDRASGDC